MDWGREFTFAEGMNFGLKMWGDLNMSSSDLFETIIVKIRTRAAASNRFARFTYGDCERNMQCGLPPHDDCLVKAMQVARDGDGRVPPPTFVSYRGVWPS